MNAHLRQFFALSIGFASWFVTHPLNAQQLEIDSLKRRLRNQPADTNRVLMLNRLGLLYYITKPDTTYRLGQQAHQLASQLGYARGQSRGLNIMAIGLNHHGRLSKSTAAHPTGYPHQRTN